MCCGVLYSVVCRAKWWCGGQRGGTALLVTTKRRQRRRNVTPADRLSAVQSTSEHSDTRAETKECVAASQTAAAEAHRDLATRGGARVHRHGGLAAQRHAGRRARAEALAEEALLLIVCASQINGHVVSVSELGHAPARKRSRDAAAAPASVWTTAKRLACRSRPAAATPIRRHQCYLATTTYNPCRRCLS